MDASTPPSRRRARVGFDFCGLGSWVSRLIGRVSHLPVVGWGVVAGLSSAVLYTLANIALRRVVAVDPFLVAAVKAAPTVILLAPIVIALRRSGSLASPATVQGRRHRHAMAVRFAGVALVGQVVGNGAFQIALGSIGLAASVPITLGSLLIGGATLGRVLLGEPVSPRKAISIGVLVIAVIVLSQARAEHTAASANAIDPQAAGEASSLPASEHSVTRPRGDQWMQLPWVGALCAMASGAAYAFFSTKMRQTMQRGLPAMDAMWISGVVGTTALWSLTLLRVGVEPVAQITAEQWRSMVAAGVFNFAAFVAISTALRFLPVVAVHLLNATQVALAAIAGVLVFAEPITGSLGIGIGLTLAGLLVLANRPRPADTAPA